MYLSVTPGAEADSVLVGIVAPRPSGANVMGHTDRPITYLAPSVTSDDLALKLVVSPTFRLRYDYPKASSLTRPSIVAISLTVRPQFSCPRTISSIMASISSRSTWMPFFSIQALAA